MLILARSTIVYGQSMVRKSALLLWEVQIDDTMVAGTRGSSPELQIYEKNVYHILKVFKRAPGEMVNSGRPGGAL
jgi:hypothetical protein